MNKIVEYQAKKQEIANIKNKLIKRIEEEEKHLLDVIEEECAKEKL
jgi:hypothetical protein